VLWLQNASGPDSFISRDAPSSSHVFWCESLLYLSWEQQTAWPRLHALRSVLHTYLNKLLVGLVLLVMGAERAVGAFNTLEDKGDDNSGPLWALHPSSVSPP
jgi:hypothetical protein